MGLKEAKEYINKLHKLQENPYNWPDYLTGLPDMAAVIKKIDDVYDRLDRYSIAFIKLKNVHPYLIKYDDSRHAEIIQWAAAILKTTVSEYRGAFVGAVGTHEFVIICLARDLGSIIKKAKNLFARKSRVFYNEPDLERKYVLSFKRDGKEIQVGLMDMIFEVLDRTDIKKHNIIPSLARRCAEREKVES
ncbi:hypothetical protein BMS3Abin07_01936 [bacterium BMS3Abin07]|nr:hypothetical protein BMS3Abin07_01936 [bacterium BMS3Abin07]GBE32107.1 hypothetical protein BMS3Bbin05_01016 [bacterium BMS3Bbin05]HDO21783.1 hypothetical protein [Nitrospirota bacterium]HDZ88611.1 hypothetical protein [Nitrospirota bacterium]